MFSCQVIPSLDLKECLFDALANGKLSLTIPWMVQYLALMDSVSFRLPYYVKLCEILYCIYRAAQNSLSQEPALLITFSIGWLFDMPNFPKDLYFNWHSTYRNEKIKLRTINRNQINKAVTKESLLPMKNTKDIRENNIILDGLNIVDDRALYACCPFLKEFNILLTSGNSNLSASNANRHITPVSSQLPQPSSGTRGMSLELQLEDAFFHGQPRSVRKTVDFISERVASNCVKYLCRSVIRKIKTNNYQSWRTITTRKTAEENKITSLQNLAISTAKDIREQCGKIIPEICGTKISNAMDALLPEDVLLPVKEMCIKIAVRMAIERTDQWLDSYINDAIASKEMFTELWNSRISGPNDTEDNNSEDIKINKIHNSQIPPPTSLINDLRNSMWELIEKGGRWTILTEKNVLKNLTNLRGVLNERIDIVPTAEKVLYTMSVDYALHLLVFMPSLLTPRVENSFIEIWKMYKSKDGDKLFSGLVSPRNVKLLSQSIETTIWVRFGIFIRRLLKAKVLSLKLFSDQCVELLRLEWPLGVLKSISSCLMEAISDYKSTDEVTAKIKELVAWIAEMCHDLSYY